MRIAVLALQGAFIEHEQVLNKLGCETFEIRKLADWEKPKDGFIIPGGESTTQAKLLNELGLLEPIRSDIRSGLPVWGTCAGLILLAESVENGTSFIRLSTMSIDVCRNAYGRQLGSFCTKEKMKYIGDDVPMTFIRAPYINNVYGKGIQTDTRDIGIAPYQQPSPYRPSNRYPHTSQYYVRYLRLKKRLTR
jgi:5'-phosphate synthase pdxT subunit